MGEKNAGWGARGEKIGGKNGKAILVVGRLTNIPSHGAAVERIATPHSGTLSLYYSRNYNYSAFTFANDTGTASAPRVHRQKSALSVCVCVSMLATPSSLFFSLLVGVIRRRGAPGGGIYIVQTRTRRPPAI